VILSISEQELRYLNYLVCCRMDDVQRKLNREHRRYDRSQTSIDAFYFISSTHKLTFANSCESLSFLVLSGFLA
jgi:hypothetical protein